MSCFLLCAFSVTSRQPRLFFCRFCFCASALQSCFGLVCLFVFRMVFFVCLFVRLFLFVCFFVCLFVCFSFFAGVHWVPPPVPVKHPLLRFS